MPKDQANYVHTPFFQMLKKKQFKSAKLSIQIKYHHQDNDDRHIYVYAVPLEVLLYL